MSWVKIDDGILNNRKIIAVSKDAKFLYIAGLCFCSANLSDGVIPAKTVNVIAAQCEIKSASRLAKELVAEGLWIDNGEEYQVHDYLEHNESSERVRAKQNAAKERMSRRRSQDVRANNQATSRKVREPDTDTDTDTEQTTASAVDRGADAPPQKSPDKPKPKAKRATQVPPDFDVTDALIAWGKTPKAGFSESEMRAQVPKFVAWYQANGKPMKDWHATFQSWMYKSRDFGQTRSSPAKSTGKITSVDELFAERVDDESTRYPENSHDFESSVASEWPGQSSDSGVDARAPEPGFRVIAGGGY